MPSLSGYFEQNKDPIHKILVDVLRNSQSVLEIGSGSGTGQHGVYFAENLPHLVWHTSDLPEYLPEITERIAREGPENLRGSLALNVCDRPWPVSSIDAIFSANTLHIMLIGTESPGSSSERYIDLQLIAAGRRGEANTVKRLLAQGASVLARDRNAVTALIAAAYQNHLEVAQLLIKADAMSTLKTTLGKAHI